MSNDKLAKVSSDELASIFGAPVGLERPDFIPEGDKTGTEGITKEDLRLPRLGIAQGLSPQMIPGDTQYIEDLKLYQMFNDTSKEVYGSGPVFFIAVRRDVRCIEFGEDGKSIIDFDVPRNDPRVTQWRPDPGRPGKKLPPAATLFNEYISMLVKKGGGLEPVVISVKNTNKYNRRAASDLNGFIKMHASQAAKSVPIYGVIYSIESKSEKNDSGQFGVPVFKQVGYIPNTDLGASLFLKVSEYAESMKDKVIGVNREGQGEDPIEGEFS